jgi:two-component system, NarL family, invasion response regulator UvrY
MKFLLVDDHAIVRKSLQNIILNEFPSATCTECIDGASCIEAVKKEKFDLIILDINLPDSDGVTLTEWIKSQEPTQYILIFSSNPASLYAKKLFQMGIMGYLNKQTNLGDIATAIRTILIQKKQFIDEEFKAILAKDFLSQHSSNPIEDLTTKELVIAQLIANGKNFDEIAAQLNIEPSTIRTYKSKIFQKMDVTNLPEFLAKAQLYKLI